MEVSRKFLLFSTILTSLLLFCKDKSSKETMETDTSTPKPIDSGSDTILIGRMSSTSPLHNPPDRIFQNGKTWKPENELDGITLFFNKSEENAKPGRITEREEFDEIRVECSSPNGSLQIYRDGSVMGAIFCSDPGRFPIPGMGVHSLFLQPSSDFEGLKSLKFYRSGKEANPVYPMSLEGKITASTTLKPVESYHPSQVFDGSIDFGWVEGVEGDGIGEWFQIEIEKEIELSGIDIFNGYQRLEELFQKNGALTQLRISNGEQSETLTIEDRTGGQRIFLQNKMKGKKFQFTLAGVRSGSKWKDTVISEVILLGTNGQRFVVRDPSAIEREKNLEAKIRSTLMEKVVGKPIKNETPMGRIDYIFRMNHSFVIWYDEEDTRKVYDGNWEIKKISKDSAEIFLFGRDHTITETISREESNYGDSIREVSTLMFRDILSVSQDTEGKIQFRGAKLELPPIE